MADTVKSHEPGPRADLPVLFEVVVDGKPNLIVRRSAGLDNLVTAYEKILRRNGYDVYPTADDAEFLEVADGLEVDIFDRPARLVIRRDEWVVQGWK
jgi:hypothetical protein